MADKLYFSRDSKLYVELTSNKGKFQGIWEIPVLDGFSFSQATNQTEIGLQEMESTAGVSRRGRRLFTDSLSPAEWSFSTYIRPFDSLGGANTAATNNRADEDTEVHAVEEVLWASMLGADTYVNHLFKRSTNPVDTSAGAVITPGASNSVIKIAESNRSALNSFVIYFLIDTATANPLVYRLPESVVNEVSIDFDVDGIAMLNWSGFSKEIQDISGNVNVSAGTGATNPVPTRTYDSNNPSTTGSVDGTNLIIGDVFISTTQDRSFNLVTNNSGTVTILRAIDEATASTKNFIRNRLTSVDIEAVEGADKVPGTFPGYQHPNPITGISSASSAVVTSTAHGFSNGDVVTFTGTCGITKSSVDIVDGKTFTVSAVSANTFTINLDTSSGTSGSFSGTPVANNGKYSLTLTGGSFTIGNNITYLVPEELGAINKPIEHVTGSRTSTGSATCYITLEDANTNSGTSRQFFNDLVGTGAMSKVVNKFKVTMHIGGSAATSNPTDPAMKIEFPTAHITVPTHSIEDVISLETEFTALPTDFGAADEITAITYYPVDSY